MAASSFVLRAANAQTGEFVGFYTGRAGQAWVGADAREAFSLGEGEASHKAALFNGRTLLHGLTFSAEAA